MSILILTGPPGSGKSTVVDLLARNSKQSAVHIETDRFYEWIKAGFTPPHLAEAQQQNETAMRAIAASAYAYWAGGYFVIVDGIVGPWFMPLLRAALAEAPVAYVVLRASPEAALARIARRDSTIADWMPDAVKKMHAAFSDLGPMERHVIDTTHATAEEIALQLNADGRAFRV